MIAQQDVAQTVINIAIATITGQCVLGLLAMFAFWKVGKRVIEVEAPYVLKGVREDIIGVRDDVLKIEKQLEALRLESRETDRQLTRVTTLLDTLITRVGQLEARFLSSHS